MSEPMTPGRRADIEGVLSLFPRDAPRDMPLSISRELLAELERVEAECDFWRQDSADAHGARLAWEGETEAAEAALAREREKTASLQAAFDEALIAGAGKFTAPEMARINDALSAREPGKELS